VNRIVIAEQGWIRELRLPSLISIFATLGLFSYSMYLTHELTIMQSWRWSNSSYLQVVNVFIAVVPATILFAWMFFWFCEKPFMVRRGATTSAPAAIPKLAKEDFPSRAFPTSLRTRLYARLRRGAHIPEPDTEPTTSAVGPTARLANTYSDSIAVADGQN
jgi:peptidoglycan/LPS O-acetylase OafA/YrhL